MEQNKFLPLGSIVLLKNGKKRLMVCGRCQKVADQQRIYDYSGCYYPEGLINPNEVYLFNNENIERTYFLGFQDQEELAFQKLLENAKVTYDKMNEEITKEEQ